MESVEGSNGGDEDSGIPKHQRCPVTKKYFSSAISSHENSEYALPKTVTNSVRRMCARFFPVTLLEGCEVTFSGVK